MTLATASSVGDPLDSTTLSQTSSQLDVPLLRQERNQCGATCLAMVLKYWNLRDAANPARGKDEIADVINPFDSIQFQRKAVKLEVAGHHLEVGCDGDVVTLDIDQRREVLHLDGQTLIGMGHYARSLGYATSLVNHATQDELKKLIDLGIPSTISTVLKPGDKYFHDVVVSGYSADASGQVTGWTVHNPWGRVEHVTPDELEQRWQTLDPLDKCPSRQLLAVAPRSQASDLPAEDKRHGELEQVAEGAL
ncbi:hypothetical protein DYH09_30665, partial [bacterium CPR1]|nr:hypothetical protein [bacterium CPR1]